MSIIPCLLVVVLLVIHVPVAIVRIVRWESVQVWSLALAALAIAMTSLAYKSTSYDPQQIYVWTSLPLILDVGAMIQLFALLFQDAQRVQNYIGRWIKKISKQVRRFGAWLSKKKQSAVSELEMQQQGEQEVLEGRAAGGQDEIVIKEETIPLASAKPRDVRAIIILLTLSGLFGITLMAMQFVGFAHAIQGLHSPQPFFEQWCSPTFKTARLVFDKECNLYPVTESPNGGADCIPIPGNQQIWLRGTAVGLGVGIACEIIDAILMTRLGRPWLTMILGITTWALFIGLGVVAGGTIPFVDQRIGIIDKVSNSTCLSTVVPGRLWGQLLSWEEGILYGLGSVYNPSAP